MCLIVLIITGFYKDLTLYLFPELNPYQTKLIEEGLQAITIVVFITFMKLWHRVGIITRISNKSIILILPIIVLSSIIFGALHLMNLFKGAGLEDIMI